MSASVSEDWLLPRSTVKTWQQMPCWKEPQCLVRRDVIPHCSGNKMGCFGVRGRFFGFRLGFCEFVVLVFFDNARLQDECFIHLDHCQIGISRSRRWHSLP